MRYFLLFLVMAGFCISVRAQQPQLTVSLDVTADKYRSELESALKKELRSFRDINLYSSSPTYEIRVVTITPGEAIAASVVVVLNLDLNSFFKKGYECLSVADKATLISVAATQYIIVSHFIVSKNIDDIDGLAKSIVANIDTDVFEHRRKQTATLKNGQDLNQKLFLPKVDDKIYLAAVKSTTANIMDGATIVETVNYGQFLALLSKDITNNSYQVINVNSGKRGFISRSDIHFKIAAEQKQEPPVNLTSTERIQEPAIIGKLVGGKKLPSITITNESDRIITLTFGGTKYVITPREAKTLNLSFAGYYDFSVSAPSVATMTSQKLFSRGYSYDWNFYIKNEYR